MNQTISVQQLRTKLPQICENLQKGASYILIRRSMPVAEIKPLEQIGSTFQTKNILELFANPPEDMLIKNTKKTAVELVRKERG